MSMVGRAISHYRLLEKLGEGGMGEVYLAEDTQLHRRVALKFMSDALASDPSFVDRFIREARAAAGLNHPNVVTVHEVGRFSDRPYISMSYVEGKPLGDVADEKDIPIDQACDIATQICSGLSHAHAKGIVHRDIKPDNVLVDAGGRVHILDFGLAKFRDVGKETGDHSTLGTIYYMSPEQASGREVDHRSDIFSVGAVLYELITGRSPFKREHSAAVLYSIVNEDPAPMTDFNSAVSADLERVVMRALAKSPDERYQTADEFAADLTRVREGQKPAGARHRSWVRIAAPTVAVFVIVLLAFFLRPVKVQFSSNPEAVAAENSLAIMYFDNLVSPDDPGRMGEIVTNLLITDLSESQYVQVVSGQRLYDILKLEGQEEVGAIDRTTATDVATRAGAKRMLLGSILQEEPVLVLTSQLIDVATGNVTASQRVEGREGEQIFDVVDRLTTEVKEDLGLPAAARREADTRLAQVTTTSQEAYRYYLEGLENANRYFLKEAKVSFEKALQYDSTMAMAYLELSSYRIPSSHREKMAAIENARRYSEHVTKRERAYIDCSYLRLTGDIEGAIDKLLSIVEQFPDDKNAYKALGDLYLMSDRDVEKSIQYLRKAVEIDPLDKWSYNVLAYQYQRVGDIDNYIWAIHQYMTLAPDEPNPYDSRADLYAYSGKIDRAIKSYQEALEKKSDFYPSAVKLGHMHLFKGDFRTAKLWYDRLAAAPDDEIRADARLYTSLIPQYQGRFQDAIDDLDEAMAVDRVERMDGKPYLAKLWFKSGVQAEKGDTEGALATLRLALEQLEKVSPDDKIAGRWRLIVLLARKGDFTAAEKALDALKTAIEGKDAAMMREYWFARGSLEAEQGKTAAAASSFEKAAANSQGFRYRHALARAYLADNRVLEAVNEYQQLMRRFSEERAEDPIVAARAYYEFGLAYENSGRHDRAIEQYETFVELWKDADPEAIEVADARQRLITLKQM